MNAPIDAGIVEALRELRALLEPPAAKARRELEEFSAELHAMGEEKKARDAEHARLHPPPPPPPRSPSLGPPCPFALLPRASLTAEQRYSLDWWDHHDPAFRARARAAADPPVPPGELAPATVEDIARYCAEELVHDEYTPRHVSELRQRYVSSAGALSTKGATDDAMAAAFVAGGLVRDDRGYFQVRDVADGAELGFASGKISSTPTEWIVPGLIPVGVQIGVVADTAGGKTTTIADLAADVANGREWLGRPTVKTQCAIINFDGRDADLRQLLHDAGAEGKVLVSSYPEHNLTSERFWSALERRFCNGSPALIVIDSLSRGSGDIDEKDARFAKPVLRAAEISNRYPISFVWLHHTPVTVRGNGLNDWLRGTSALGAAFDIGFGLSKVSSSASPRETIIKVQTLKMRPKEVIPPPPFKLRITDAGLALYEETPRKAAAAVPLTDDEQVLAAVRATPGIGSNGIAAFVDIRAADMRAARRRLEAAGVIENRGSTKNAKWFAI